ncbi:hypothetical protein FI667_g2430, partial [Globisporangium splendens]
MGENKQITIFSVEEEKEQMMERTLYFQLVNERGDPLARRTNFVAAEHIEDVADFQMQVKSEFDSSHLAGIAASNLTVCANRAAFDEKKPLAPNSAIGSLGGATEDALVVVVLECAAGAAATATLTVGQMEMTLKRFFDERDRRRSEYSISNCPSSKEMELLQRLDVDYDFIEVNEVQDYSIAGYQWPQWTEKRPEQRKAYIRYIEEHLRDAFFAGGTAQKYFVEDVANSKTLLNCNDRRRLPFGVKGTADLMIVDTQAKRAKDVFPGLCFVIEVKKNDPSEHERFQLLLELIVADLKSQRRRSPVGLLTDLNDYWYFL